MLKVCSGDKFLSVCRRYRIPPLGEMAPTKGAASSRESDIRLIFLHQVCGLEAVNRYPIYRIADLQFEGLVFPLENFVRSCVGGREGGLGCIHTNKYMGCPLEICWHEGFPCLLVRLLAGYETREGVLKMRGGEVGALAKEVSWNGEGISVDSGSRGMVIFILGGCAEAEHDPRELLLPLVGSTSCHERCFQTPMKTLDHAVGFRVVSSGCRSRDAETLGKLRPKTSGEN